MSELWRMVVGNAQPALLERLTLDKAYINRAGTKIVVGFLADRLLKGDEYAAVKKALTEALEGAKLTLNIAYPALAAQVRDSIDEYVPFLVGLITHNAPGARSFLDSAKWTFRGGELALELASEVGASYLRQRQVDEGLRNLMKNLFHLDCVVDMRAAGDERQQAQEALARQLAEEKKMAEQSLNSLPLPKEPGSDAPAPAPDKAKPRQPIRQAARKRSIADPEIPIGALIEGAERVAVAGEVSRAENRMINGQMILFTFRLTDPSGSVFCKAFVKDKNDGNIEALRDALKPGARVKLRGKYQEDDFRRGEKAFMIEDIAPQNPFRETFQPYSEESEEEILSLFQVAELSDDPEEEPELPPDAPDAGESDDADPPW